MLTSDANINYSDNDKIKYLVETMFSETDDYSSLSQNSLKDLQNIKFEFLKNFNVPSKLFDDKVYLKKLQENELKENELESKLKLQKEEDEKNLEKFSQKNQSLEALRQKYSKFKEFNCSKPIKRRFGKASQELDKRRTEKNIVDEAELSFKFRAKALPETTYQPNLIKPKPMTRIDDNSRNDHNAVFSFVPTDEIRKQQKLSKIQNTLTERENHAKLLANKFKALPPPTRSEKYVERMKEIEEYRKIKKYVRMDTTLFESRLPFTNKYDVNGKILFF